MTTQPEQILENNLVIQLVALGYNKVVLFDEVSMLYNLKAQINRETQQSHFMGTGL
jgi:type I restriction enzyme R subunit